ncbi:hypothetical protein EIN_184490 [Entamoeba invadens IP1]|uniref:hypothetical protein n=1 Tax=Entamoeba invadens IP1 TaxID=370355 RepID=UPI0002C3DD20|nr:hypothetical protein EIN_184490 [Entamoeba invadens IP1]ELP94092.1 hypothetical protein EIN_184490 [Entamoeba invadens IP1]|eukprot:XP_004260863.1 hypothetical protein EIN_184490 [Entamoeba invadens IP1]
MAAPMNTIAVFDIPETSDISNIVGMINNQTRVNMEAIEMISPTQAYVKYENPQLCAKAFQFFCQGQSGMRAVPALPDNIIDLPLAKKLASMNFLCSKSSLDLSCVPPEYMVALD